MNQDTDRSFAVHLIRRDVDGASTAIIFRDEPHAALFDIRDGSYSEGGSYNQSYDDVLNPVS